MINYSEIFYSLQGEGKHIGTPSIFVRLWGCNLTCSGFSNPENKDVIVSDSTSLETLKEADFHYGCDSRYSWHKDYKHLIKTATAQEVVDQIYDLLPSGKWFIRDQPIHLIFTGGEPTLHQGGIIEILDEVYKRQGTNGNPPEGVTIETNASVALKHNIIWNIPKYIETDFTWSNSPKLSHSGEKLSQTIRPEVIRQQKTAGGKRVYKFVVRDNDADFEEINEALAILEPFNNYDYTVYVMPLGVTKEQIQMNAAGVAKRCLTHGFRYTDRLQVTLYDSQIGT